LVSLDDKSHYKLGGLALGAALCCGRDLRHFREVTTVREGNQAA
jgi:hypothetical protein